MWKVLLVEDEPFVRRTIREKTDWQGTGFVVVGEAGDGAEALAMMESLQPDLVIADIVMPIMDGIQLLRESKARGYESRFVMLTCMNEFEYARQSLEFGASGYILKLSMNVQSLRDMLLKVAAELEQRRKEKLRMVLPDAQKLYMEAWNAYVDPNAGRTGIARQEWWSQDRSREMLESSGLKWVSVASAWCGADPKPVLRQLRERWCADGSVVVHEFAARGIVTLFQWSAQPFEVKADRGHLDVVPIVSGTVNVDAFPQVWYHVLHRLNEKWYDGSLHRTGMHIDPIAFTDADKRKSAEGKAEWPWKLEIELVQSFEKRTDWQTAFDKLCSAIAEFRYPFPVVQLAALRIRDTLRQIADLKADSSMNVWDPACCQSFLEFQNQFHQQLAALHAAWLQSGAMRTDHAEINQILQFIHRHYDRDITLKMMARMVAMDENYLSGLFKRKTGESLIQYVQRVRIREAKRLLEQTDLSVVKIGEMVGFANANYFFKIFKRWTGLTPNDYRKNH
mgnify:CR=1 FL=1